MRMVLSGVKVNGLFSLFVSITLGCSLYDWIVTVRHLERSPTTSNYLETTLREYLSSYRRTPSQLRPAHRSHARDAPPPDSLRVPPAPPPVTPLLLLPEHMEWRRRRANARHLLQDGVEQSPWLTWWERTHNEKEKDDDAETEEETIPLQYPEHLVLVLDLLGARESKHWCKEIQGTIQSIQEERLAQIRASPRNSTPAPPLPLAIVDNRDYPVISYCPGLARILSQGNTHQTLMEASANASRQQPLIRYSFRSAVRRRKWLPGQQWVRTGQLLLNATELDDEGEDSSTDDDRWIEYRHRPIGVRSDIVRQVQEYLTLQESSIEPLSMRPQFTSLCHPLERMARDIHVSYFWDHQNHSRSDAHLRDTVFEVLENMRQSSHSHANHSHWTFHLGVQGENRDKGRKRASPDYVVALMKSRIVVVAQRDEWEDHYRLFEAIVSGAMVITDRMLGLPAGLVEGESVVTYGSSEELRERVSYYLQHEEERLDIARRGRYVAMSRHRSWHHMEEIVFGRPMTVCGEGTGSKCPYVVTTDEMKDDCPPLPSASASEAQT